MFLITQIILSFIAGIIGGVISSMPPGPTEFWIARRVLNQEQPRLNYFIAGVITCDILYAGIAFWGYYGVIQKSGLTLIISAVGASALVILGLYDFWKFRKQPCLINEGLKDISNETVLDDYASGFFLCGFNVVFVLFWVFFAATLFGMGLKMQVVHNIAVLAGIVVGDCIWYKIFEWFVFRGKQRLSSSWFHWLQQSFSLGLCLFGVAALYEIFNP